MTAGRRWFLRALLVVLSPFLLLLALEVALRLGGYGHPTEFLLPCEVKGEPALADNPFFARRFQQPGLERRSLPFTIRRKKPGVTRLFLIGESAAMGFPYEAAGPGRMLETLLNARHPGRRFEVIIAAAAAINSHVLVPMAEEILDKGEPDLIVIYAGNNEVVGPFGPGTVFTPFFSSTRLQQLAIFLNGTRLGQFARHLGAWVEARHHPERRRWQGMSAFMDHLVPADDPRLAPVYERFHDNIASILRAAERRGVAVLLTTVPVNVRDCPPFASVLRRESRDWHLAYEEGRAAEAERRPGEALAAYARAALIDSGHAELLFRRARCHEALGETQAAIGLYRAALDADALRFRADARLNAALRSLSGGKRDARFAFRDVDEAFSLCSSGLPGDSLFVDHAHLSFEGAWRFAAALVPVVEQLLAASEPPRPMPLPDTCAALLGYTNWDRAREELLVYNLIKFPPFTDQCDHASHAARVLETMRRHEAALTPAVLEEAGEALAARSRRCPDDWIAHEQYGIFLAEMGVYDSAAAAFACAAELVPHSPDNAQHLAFARQLAALPVVDPAAPGVRVGGQLLPRDGTGFSAITVKDPRESRGLSVPLLLIERPGLVGGVTVTGHARGRGLSKPATVEARADYADGSASLAMLEDDAGQSRRIGGPCGWRYFELPLDAHPRGLAPIRITIGATVAGPGTVDIGNVRLLSRPPLHTGSGPDYVLGICAFALILAILIALPAVRNRAPRLVRALLVLESIAGGLLVLLGMLFAAVAGVLAGADLLLAGSVIAAAALRLRVVLGRTGLAR